MILLIARAFILFKIVMQYICSYSTLFNLVLRVYIVNRKYLLVAWVYFLAVLSAFSFLCFPAYDSDNLKAMGVFNSSLLFFVFHIY